MRFFTHILSRLLPVMLPCLFSLPGLAQDCDQWPGDCPDPASIQNALDRTIREGNGFLPREVAMQDQLRRQVTLVVEKMARQLHWRVIELDEITNLNPFQRSGTPYELRSPRAYGIAFQLICNRDSIQTARAWMQEYNDRMTKEVENNIKEQQQMVQSPTYRRYKDSADRYINLYSSYADANARTINSPATQKKLQYYLNKQKEYSDKLVELTNNPASNEEADKEEADKNKKILAFRNASFVQIFVDFNDNVGIVGPEGNTKAWPLQVPGVPLAIRAYNNSPEVNTMLWHPTDRWGDYLILLAGKWFKESPSDLNYQAAFTRHGQSDEKTPKKIKSDQVQNMVIHILGRPDHLQQVINALDIPALMKLVPAS